MYKQKWVAITKKIGKKVAALAFLAGLLATSGCAEKSYVLKAGFSTSETDPRVEATQLFKEEVEAATEGRIQIEIYHSGELGSDAELIEGIVNGSVDITASSAGNFANYDPNIGISAFPFLFTNFDEAWDFVDGSVEKRAEEKLLAYNIHVMSHYDNGFRCVTTSESYGPVDTTGSIRGLSIRVPDNPIVLETMRALGAEPSVLAFTETYDALKDGRFDAQENPIPVIYNNKLYEVQKNLSITNHSYDVMPFVIREDLWNSLSEDDKNILTTAAKKAQDMNRKLVMKQTEACISELEQAGMHVVYPDLEAFKQATRGVIDALSLGYDKDILDAVR